MKASMGHIKLWGMASIKWAALVLSGIVLAMLTASKGVVVPSAIIALAVAIVLLYAIFSKPVVGFIVLIIAGFFAIGSSRYLPLPLGLSIDGILVLTFMAYFFKNFKTPNWKALKTPLVLVLVVWMGYNFLEVVNPEARSLAAWFYAMRGTALYFVLTVILTLLLFDPNKDTKWFIDLWLFLSVLGTLWGAKQLLIGLDGAEKTWLSVPGNKSTHILFGKLRVFSFYSDAGQFGAAQAHALVVSGILAINASKWSKRILYGTVALLSLYGMLISGTRGAIVIPVIGIGTYLLLVKNWKIVIIGAIVMGSAFGMLKYTHIAHNVYEIRRLRTGLDPNNPSLMVRIENQKRLKEYLKTRPIGGGVGSAGYWGQRFSPNSFLANLALDSWYVRIAAEYGFVGLFLYIGILLYIVFVSFKNTFACKNDEQRKLRMALLSGLVGILVASYGNQILGQMPTAIVCYISIALLFVPHIPVSDDKHA